MSRMLITQLALLDDNMLDTDAGVYLAAKKI
jgi:hypothetical protein